MTTSADVRDDVLGRLLALNAERAREEARAGVGVEGAPMATPMKAKGKKRQSRHGSEPSLLGLGDGH